MLSFLLGLLCLAAFVPPAGATSVIPPTFPELVAEADAIYRGTVSSIEARHVDRPDGNGRVIKTFVTVTVERTMKGPARPEVTLEFLGGTVGDESLAVTGMPKFAVGDREFVFVQRNGTQFCPLVAVSHGRYRVKRDATGREMVARDNGMPLTDTSEVALPLPQLPAAVRAATTASMAANALTPAAFETSVLTQLRSPVPAARPN